MTVKEYTLWQHTIFAFILIMAITINTAIVKADAHIAGYKHGFEDAKEIYYGED